MESIFKGSLFREATRKFLPGTASIATPDSAIDPANEAFVNIRNLVKVYKTPAGEFPALKSVSLKLDRGEFVAITGKSGSGKSTLLNTFTGIDHPTSGEVFIGGEALHTYGEQRKAIWRGRNLGIIFQFFQLLPTLSTVENVIMAMDLNNVIPANKRRKRAIQLLASVGLAEKANKMPSELSGGEQQRVAIARSLANDPPLIVADEPTGNLDSNTAETVFTLFKALVAEGKTFIMVTHDNDLARRAGRNIILSDGQIISHGYDRQEEPDAQAGHNSHSPNHNGNGNGNGHHNGINGHNGNGAEHAIGVPQPAEPIAYGQERSLDAEQN